MWLKTKRIFEQPTVFFDMDGCICKWKQGETHKDGYFLALEAEENMIELVRMVHAAGYPVYVLSAAYPIGTAGADKETWLQQHRLADVPVLLVPYGTNKADNIGGKGHVLVDDLTKNLKQWEAAEFKGVKFYNGINGNHGTWKGRYISHQMSPKEMFSVIRDTISSE